MEAMSARRGEDAAPPAAAATKVVLIGFMGAGKSRAAVIAGRRLGAEVIDTDALLEQRLGEPIASFFDRDGEAAFREREQAVVLELLERPGAAVLALGGGAITSEQVRARLREHLCLYLEADLDLAWERSRESGRPLARERASFERLHAERAPLYESAFRAVLPGGRGDQTERALEAALGLADARTPPTVRMAWACTSSPPGGYPVYLGVGTLDAAAPLWPAGGRAFAVADERVRVLHGERLETALTPVGLEQVIAVPPGERHKTLAEAESVLRALARAGMERSDVLVAFGGGVVGDLAGLCAAIYQRGVRAVQVPTTLVAQVDSAYGGKSGVDIPEAKNYVGVFHQPAAVLADPSLLATLPAAELRAGFAEVVKTGLISGGGLWERVRALSPIEHALGDEPEALAAVIEGCVRTKLAVVAEDERELGVRASLNLGHTFAHALEAATGYEGYRHGEAVGVGLLAALRVSEQELGLDGVVRAEVEALLERHGLPVRFEGASTDEIMARAALDKKRRGGRARLALLRSPGNVVTGCEVDDASLREAIEEFRGAAAPGAAASGGRRRS
jgi:shikimate kinase/3-dehydroquinate synthase